MKLIFGLGNPGKQYQNTRHNLGQKIILQYVRAYCHTPLQPKKSLDAEILEIGQGSNKIIFAISTDYMNNSGTPVQNIFQFYKINPSDIYILHDDLDLEVGDYRVQFNRGPAGHNGIKSIIENLGTQQFNRIRIGIGKPTNNISVEDYVLQPFSKTELDIINTITPKIFKEVEMIINL
jgi:peptidyl-tRNA hydrolase, PTH1 family